MKYVDGSWDTLGKFYGFRISEQKLESEEAFDGFGLNVREESWYSVEAAPAT